MNENTNQSADVNGHENCDELIGILSAISIVAKRLANRLTTIKRQIEDSETEKRISGKERKR